MTVPALISSFPSATASPQDHSTRVRVLAVQWQLMHKIGNSFFRPISTLAIFGYAYGAYSCYHGKMRGDWRLYAAAAVCHIANVVHSAVNLQPCNDKLDALGTGKVDDSQAVDFATYWINCNKWRIVFPFFAGGQAIYQAFMSL